MIDPNTKTAIDDAVNAAIEPIQQTVRDAVLAAQGQLMATLPVQVAEAVKRNQRVVIAASPEHEPGDSRTWKIAMLLLPTILSALLGVAIWNVQNGIEDELGRQTETLKSELALREEFFKRKLDTYQTTHTQIALLASALDNTRFDPKSIPEGISQLSKLDQAIKSQNLYMSNKVVVALKNLWNVATDVPPLRRTGTSTMSDVVEAMGRVEKEMKDDLHVNEIGETSRLFKGAAR